MEYFTLKNIAEVVAVTLLAYAFISVITNRLKLKKGFLFKIVFVSISVVAGFAAGNIIEVEKISQEKEKVSVQNYCNKTILEDYKHSSLPIVLNKIKSCKHLGGKIRL